MRYTFSKRTVEDPFDDWFFRGLIGEVTKAPKGSATVFGVATTFTKNRSFPYIYLWRITSAFVVTIFITPTIIS